MANKPQEIYSEEHYSYIEICQLLDILQDFGVPVRRACDKFYNDCKSAWEKGWEVVNLTNPSRPGVTGTRHVWQMYYFADRDLFDMFGILYCTPLEDMPLFINIQQPIPIVANWRLNIGK